MLAFAKVRFDWRCACHDSAAEDTTLFSVSASTTKSLLHRQICEAVLTFTTNYFVTFASIRNAEHLLDNEG